MGTVLALACTGDEPRGTLPSSDPSLPASNDAGLTDPSVGTKDGATASDAAAGDAKVPVDCYPDLDGDGFPGPGAIVRGHGGCPPRTTRMQGPADCDDTDAHAFPGSTYASSVARSAGGFDFDCDGKEVPFASVGGVLMRCAAQSINCTQVDVAVCDQTALCLTGGTEHPSHAPMCGANGDTFTLIACARSDAGGCTFAPEPPFGYEMQTTFACR
jgi:hypothetical protein